jgi:6-phosphogluconolactonase
MAAKFAEELICLVSESAFRKKPLTVALSGGSTPELLFSLLGENSPESVPWEYVHFFWGDERCVPADSQESNYGMARRKFLEKIEIPSGNIHRIRGEADPEEEAVRYSSEIVDNTRKRDGWPVFDLILLGLGEDGHTASIFRRNIELLESEKICETALHPVTLQKRITITGRVINNSDSVVFLVTGRNKAEIIQKILHNNPVSENYPAASIAPVHGELKWFIDEDAALLL